jgi:cyclophilin family peptidyl-prolyl cis-trans isomerase
LFVSWIISGPLTVGSSIATAGPTADKWDSTYGEWKDLLAQLRELRTKYGTAEESELESLKQQYADLVAKGRDMIERLRADGLAAYEEAPNEDRELTRFLVKLTEDDIRNDKYEKAAEVAKLLIDNDCGEKAVYNSAGIAAFALHDFPLAKECLEEAKSADALSGNGEKFVDEVDNYIEFWKKEQQLREAEEKADDLPRVKLQTNKGELVIELLENEAPQTVGNFVSLVEKGFYDGLTFHRVLPGFMAQGGCPKGDGTGGPGYSIYCECDRDDARMHFRGSLSMAHSGRNTGGSQFFLTVVPTPWLNDQHTVFGRVVEGLDVLEQLQRRDPDKEGALPEPDKIVKAEVLRKRPDHKYVPTKVE